MASQHGQLLVSAPLANPNDAFEQRETGEVEAWTFEQLLTPDGAGLPSWMLAGTLRRGRFGKPRPLLVRPRTHPPTHADTHSHNPSTHPPVHPPYFVHPLNLLSTHLNSSTH